MVVTETIAGLSAIKTAFDMSKALQGIHDAVAHDRAVIELQKEILAAHAAQSELIQAASNLEKKLAEFENWEAEKARYYLRDYGGGTFAFELRGEPPGGEPAHRICPACYQERKKGLLPSRGQDAFHREMVKCSSCDKEFVLGTRIEPNSRVRSYSPRAQSDFDIFTGR